MNALLCFGGWSIIPDLASQYLLKAVYSTPLLLRLFNITPAAPGTPQFRKHYGLTFALVVLGYLLYTLLDKALNAPPNFYEILGVDWRVDEAGLKAAFRQFARKNHPDRPGVGKGGEALFIYVRDVYEALKDPSVRFAYDRYVLIFAFVPLLRVLIQMDMIDSDQTHLAGAANAPHPPSSSGAVYNILLATTSSPACSSPSSPPFPNLLPSHSGNTSSSLASFSLSSRLSSLPPQPLLRHWVTKRSCSGSSQRGSCTSMCCFCTKCSCRSMLRSCA